MISRNNKLVLLVAAMLIQLASLTSCMSVAAYQKAYLNDTDMEMSDRPIEAFEQGFQTYREGASGGNGGKTGGGCGCN